MAITGIDTIDGKQIIAAGAVSAKSAEMAYNDENGNPITSYLTAVPEGYATTGDLTAYQTTAGMTAYLTAVPDTYLQNSDLTITDGKISEISGVPLSAGDELPSGVMNTSALEYNAVNEISGYNGSAIAQYGAEKQWLVHDDTIVHMSNSAQYAFGVNLSAVAQLLGVDETILWSGTSANSFTLSEPSLNFKRLRIKLRSYQSPDYYTFCECLTNSGYFHFEFENQVPAAGYQCQYAGYRYTTTDDLTYTFSRGNRLCFGVNGGTYSDISTNLIGSDMKDAGYPVEIVGIGRKQ